MYLRPRHRRGSYPLAAEHTLPRSLRLLLALGALLLVAYLVWTLLLRLLGFDSASARAGAFLTVEERGTVNVTIDDKQQRAENGMLLLPGESISTGPGAHASLRFFDGSRARLNDGTALTLTESSRGSKTSRLTLNLMEGKLWIATAGTRSFTGSVVWTVDSPVLGMSIPPGTEAVVSPSSVSVFSTDGEGVTLTMDGHEPFLISEGQQWVLPPNATVGGNVYEFRSPLDPLETRSAFVMDSRTRTREVVRDEPVSIPRGSGSVATGDGILAVTAPANGITVKDPTVIVQGTVGEGVTRILVNGYPALLDTVKRTFSQEVSPPEGTGPFEIAVQAQDETRAVLSEVRRTVQRAPAAPLEAPTVTVPAKTGDTYRTQAEELILRGGAPKGAAGIYVNDYKLQLFDPAKGEWSYVASLKLRNMIPGTNIYDVYAVDAAGKKTAPGRITIIQGGEGAEGVVSPAIPGTPAAASSASSAPLPQNAPLEPGTLQIQLPTAGTSHTETGTGFLLIGTTSAKTTSLYVNDYKLQLYRAGRTTWNYVADAAINNLKKGKNTYVIVARNAASEILDTLTYTVQYDPK